jgi:XTP/dITP diphosphohydrolase
MDLLLATRNAHKTREVQRILGPHFVVRDLSKHPEIPEIEESGKSFEENAVLKAMAASNKLPDLVIADDSGLEVDALNGAPGIYSARYAGERATDQENNHKLLHELKRANAGGDQRSARFRCVLALARESRMLGSFEGVVEGTIVNLPRGDGGFGYDPLFKAKGFDRTFGELAPAEKDQLSHRARALEKLRAFVILRSPRRPKDPTQED